VSNKQDLQLLLSERWRDRTAVSVAGAIDSYFASHIIAHAGIN
jgi:N-acetylmuramoyl-L-alanine amidase